MADCYFCKSNAKIFVLSKFMKILVLGSDGQLGSAFKDLSKNYNNINFIFLSQKKINYLNYYILRNFITKEKNVDLIINCCAFTNVNDATKQYKKALIVNYLFVIKLSKICKYYKIDLVHYSTDYVFDGKNKIPYKENSKTNPLNVYGLTKLKADNFLLKQKFKALIIRTSWVFSYSPRSFVGKIIKISKINKCINVVDDQVGCPTYAADLASTTIKIILHKKFISLKKTLLVNFCNKGSVSWYDFAKKILNIKKINCSVMSIQSNTLKNSTIRPNYSVLETSKIEKYFKIRIRTTKVAIKECLQNQK